MFFLMKQIVVLILVYCNLQFSNANQCNENHRDRERTFSRLDYVGRGYDLLKASPHAKGGDRGFKAPIFKISPFCGNWSARNLSLDANIVSAKTCSVIFESWLADTPKSFAQQLARLAYSKAEYAGTNNSISLLTAFKASKEFQQVERATRNDGKLAAEAAVFCTLFSASLKKSSQLTTEFRKDILELPLLLSNDEERRQLFGRFFAKYGTHVVVEATMGAAYVHRMILSKIEPAERNQQLRINLSLRAALVASNNSKLITEYYGFGGDQVLNIKQMLSSKIESEEQAQIGAKLVLDITPERWQKETMSDASPVKVSLANIASLISPLFFPDMNMIELLRRRNALNNALDVYCENYLLPQRLVKNCGPNLQILEAASACNLAQVRQLVEQRGADVETANSVGQTALQMASANGCYETAEYLVKQAGATIDYASLHEAVKKGDEKIAKILLDNSAIVNDANLAQLLALAVHNGHETAVSLLIERGAKANVRRSNGWSLLMDAILGGNMEIVKLLNKSGSDKDTDLLTIVRQNECSFSGCSFKITFYLLELGANPNANDGKSAIVYAMETGRTGSAILLAKKGANVNVKLPQTLRTPLMEAAIANDIALGLFLIDYGAQLDDVDIDGKSALFHALGSGHTEFASLLIDKGCLMNQAEERTKVSPLHLAARRGYFSLVKHMLRAGADPNLKTNANRTVLMSAVESGDFEIVKLLLDKGADWERHKSFNAFDLALYGDRWDMAALMNPNEVNMTAVQLLPCSVAVENYENDCGANNTGGYFRCEKDYQCYCSWKYQIYKYCNEKGATHYRAMIAGKLPNNGAIN